MADVRSMFEKEFLYAYDLDGKEWTMEIASVARGELTGTGGKKTKKPIIKLKGAAKALALNITNVRTIGAMYGFKAEEWVGKKITIYPTTTNFGANVVDCIRVKPTVPKGAAKPMPDAPPPERSPGEDDDHEAVA